MTLATSKITAQMEKKKKACVSTQPGDNGAVSNIQYNLKRKITAE